MAVLSQITFLPIPSKVKKKEEGEKRKLEVSVLKKIFSEFHTFPNRWICLPLYGQSKHEKGKKRTGKEEKERSDVVSLTNTCRHNILQSWKTSSEETMQTSEMWRLPE